ncbi:hypothetical protein [Sporosarcina sp. P13]|uniref:hypothetical protein n=1 Tax=Sporosarcina sp. P13 TaxID=2048263 RepID=UPI00130419F9|nr:hypothetical protein [Sporosarcina sp. P13]
MFVKDKLGAELTNAEITERYGSKNYSQIKTYIKWYRANEFYQFNQPIGMQ